MARACGSAESGAGAPGWAHADGVLPSANVPRPSGSSLISLRGAHHRREPGHRGRTGRTTRARLVHRAVGASRSEIKEEPKAGDIRGGKGLKVESPPKRHTLRVTPPQLKELRLLKIAVIHPDDSDGRQLTQQLQRIGCQVQAFWPPVQALPEGIDVAFMA
eukprot:gene31633-35715_t